MTQTLIKWRLREVMARYRIKAVDLAKEMGISPNSISNLRNSDTMPRLDGSSLNNLCNALNQLALGLEEEITPVTLIDYTRDLEPEPKNQFLKRTESQTKTTKANNHLSSSEGNQLSGSKIILLSKAESA